MARISFALSGIERTLLNHLAEANAAIVLSTLRATTGHQITAPADNPSAFVALSSLQSELSQVTAATSNVTAAAGMVGQAQTALGGITTQLGTIRTQLLTDADGSLTPDQRAAAQAKIDAAIDQINSLAGTSINGRKLLGGQADFAVTGRNYAQVADLSVRRTGGAAQTISGSVTQAGTRATLTYTGDADNKVVADASFTLTGDLGGVDVTVTTGESLADVAAEINGHSHQTGITAAVGSGANTLTLTSVDYGSAALGQVTVLSGTFSVSGGDSSGTSHGSDATATINGIDYTGDGNRFSVGQNSLQFTVEFRGGFSGSFDTMTVSGDALSFALTTDVAQRATLAIPDVQAAKLGGLSGSLSQLASGGPLAGLASHTSQAIRVVDEALGQIARIGGAVDGFYNASVTSASNLLSGLQLKLTNSIDAIDHVDDATEAQVIAHYQSLASNAVAGLAVLNQQRQGIVVMIQKIAGLI